MVLLEGSWVPHCIEKKSSIDALRMTGTGAEVVNATGGTQEPLSMP